MGLSLKKKPCKTNFKNKEQMEVQSSTPIKDQKRKRTNRIE